MTVGAKERKSVTIDLVKCACRTVSASSMPKRDSKATDGSIVGRPVPTITRVAMGASTLAASATAEWRPIGSVLILLFGAILFAASLGPARPF